MMIRHPAVAGTFYSHSPEKLRADVVRYRAAGPVPRPAIAIISPHAGLLYSGHVAGAVFARVTLPRTVILVGPNHTGLGPPVSVFPEGAWLMPGGAVPVDADLARRLLARWPDAVADTEAHRLEHCLEVQLPFLQSAREDPRDADPAPVLPAAPLILPILLRTARLEVCRSLGLCLAHLVAEEAARTAGAPPLLLASTDMSHYEPDAVTRAKDRFAIAAIERLDPDALQEAVRTHGISMCGLSPTITILHAARALGAAGASLVRYGTSADASGDESRVVGYAGFTIMGIV